MRNFINVSYDGRIHYSTQTKRSDNNNFKAKDDDDGFGAAGGLDIPPDNIDDVYWITNDFHDFFFNKADLDQYFDDFDDNGDLIVIDDHRTPPVQEPESVPQETSTKDDNRVVGLDIPTDEINDNMIKVIDLESDLFLDKVTDDTCWFFDGFDDDKGDLLVTQETDGNLKKKEARAKDNDQKASCRLKDHRRQLKRRETSQEITKPLVVKNLNEVHMEIKLTDIKRKIREGYQDKAKKKRKIKVIDYIPPPQIQTIVPKKPCKTKTDCLSSMRKNLKNEILQVFVSKKPCQNSRKDYVSMPLPEKPNTCHKRKDDLLRPKNDCVQVPVPKKARTCNHKRKDDLSRLKNDYVQVPAPEKPRTCQKRKDESLRPKRDQVEVPIRMIVVALPALRRR